MHVPIPVLAAGAIVLLVLIWLALRGRDRRRDLIAPPDFPPQVHPARRSGAASLPPSGLQGLSPESEAEILALVRGGQKLEAIKRLRELKPAMSLQEAKQTVERM